MLEVEVAGLFDHVLEGGDGGLVLVVQGLLEAGDGLFDGATVFACRALVGGGTDEAVGEQGQNEQEELFTGSLGAQDTAARSHSAIGGYRGGQGSHRRRRPASRRGWRDRRQSHRAEAKGPGAHD